MRHGSNTSHIGMILEHLHSTLWYLPGLEHISSRITTVRVEKNDSIQKGWLKKSDGQTNIDNKFRVATCCTHKILQNIISKSLQNLI